MKDRNLKRKSHLIVGINITKTTKRYIDILESR